MNRRAISTTGLTPRRAKVHLEGQINSGADAGAEEEGREREDERELHAADHAEPRRAAPGHAPHRAEGVWRGVLRSVSLPLEYFVREQTSIVNHFARWLGRCFPVASLWNQVCAARGAESYKHFCGTPTNTASANSGSVRRIVFGLYSLLGRLRNWL